MSISFTKPPEKGGFDENNSMCARSTQQFNFTKPPETGGFVHINVFTAHPSCSLFSSPHSSFQGRLRGSASSSSRSARRSTPRARWAGPSSSSCPRWRSWSVAHHYRARAGGHAPGEAGGPPDREVAAGREPGAGRPRRSGMSLTQVAKKHCISRASVCPLMKANENSHPVLLGSGGDLGLEAGL
jgi:hypothetical protein